MEIRQLNNGVAKTTAAITDAVPVQDENGKTWYIEQGKVLDLFKSQMKPPLQSFILKYQNSYDAEGDAKVPIYKEDLGGGIFISPKFPLNLDVDLAEGNFAAISIGVPVKSLTLPQKYKESLVYLEIVNTTFDVENVIELRLSDYPNLASAYVNPGARNNKPYGIKIADNVIDLPRIGGLHLGGSKRVPYAITNPELTVNVYRDMTLSLISYTLQQLMLDFVNFTPSGLFQDGQYTFPSIPFFRCMMAIFGNPNLTDLAFENLPTINNSFSTNTVFNFRDNNLTQISVDGILGSLNSHFTNSAAESEMELYLNSRNQNQIYVNESNLIIGNTYTVEIYDTDDFSNVGYVADGVPFVATGTTPLEWVSSTVIALNYGCANEFEVVSTGTPLPDGRYTSDEFFMEWQGGIMTNIIINSPYLFCELNSIRKLQYFTIQSETDPTVTIWGNATDEYDIEIKITGVSNNAAPTGGTANPDYLELIAKGWTVEINS